MSDFDNEPLTPVELIKELIIETHELAQDKVNFDKHEKMFGSVLAEEYYQKYYYKKASGRVDLNDEGNPNNLLEYNFNTFAERINDIRDLYYGMLYVDEGDPRYIPSNIEEAPEFIQVAHVLLEQLIQHPELEPLVRHANALQEEEVLDMSREERVAAAIASAQALNRIFEQTGIWKPEDTKPVSQIRYTDPFQSYIGSLQISRER